MARKTGAARTTGPGRGEIYSDAEQLKRLEADEDTGAAPPDDEPGPDDYADRDNDDLAGDAPPLPDLTEEDERPEKPPSDEARDAIAARFAKSRQAEFSGEPGAAEETDEAAEIEDKLGGDAAEGDEKKPEGEAEEKEDTAETMTLVVRGKTVTKTLDEVAALAEMSPDEIKADPKRAQRYAQKELAAGMALQEANDTLQKSRRGDQPRQDSADRTERTAPDQERDESGDDDDPDQTAPSRRTTGDDDAVKLVEAIQLEDPKEAGAKLQATLDQMVDRRMAQGKETMQSEQDRHNLETGIQGFFGENKAAADNPYLQGAIGTALYDEYRVDLEKALLADGKDPRYVEALLAEATNEELAKGHQKRRLRGDPNVRQLSKEFFGAAYQRVTKSLGVKPGQDNPAQDRTARVRDAKVNLTPQPRRASAPPANARPAPKPVSRSDVVAEIRAGRGQGAPARS